jgi:hypothetical protein
MKFIFASLPIDLINNILLYDEHFIMRKGEIISIIPKTDDRYKLLNYITYSPEYVEKNGNTYDYKYYFQNLYNYDGRKTNNSDLIQIKLTEYEDSVKYEFWIGRQYPKSISSRFGKKQIYHIEDPLHYNWVFTQFEFIRFEYVRP